MREERAKSISQRAKEIHTELGFPENSTVTAVCTILSAIEHDCLPAAVDRAFNDSEMRMRIMNLISGNSSDEALNSAFLTLLNFSIYDLGEGNDAPSPERVAKLAEILQHGAVVLQEGYQHYTKEKESRAVGD